MFSRLSSHLADAPVPLANVGREGRQPDRRDHPGRGNPSFAAGPRMSVQTSNFAVMPAATTQTTNADPEQDGVDRLLAPVGRILLLEPRGRIALTRARTPRSALLHQLPCPCPPRDPISSSFCALRARRPRPGTSGRSPRGYTRTMPLVLPCATDSASFMSWSFRPDEELLHVGPHLERQVLADHDRRRRQRRRRPDDADLLALQQPLVHHRRGGCRYCRSSRSR